MIYLTNVFSIGMIPLSKATITMKEINLEEVKKLVSTESKIAVNHQSIADVLSYFLDEEILPYRENIILTKDDSLIVFQLSVRLREGYHLSEQEMTNLPYKFYLIKIK